MYRPSQLQANAVGLSRLPLNKESGDVPLPGDMILMMEAVSNADSVVTFCYRGDKHVLEILHEGHLVSR